MIEQEKLYQMLNVAVGWISCCEEGEYYVDTSAYLGQFKVIYRDGGRDNFIDGISVYKIVADPKKYSYVILKVAEYMKSNNYWQADKFINYFRKCDIDYAKYFLD